MSKFGKFFKNILLPIGAIALGPVLGGILGPALGIGANAATALGTGITTGIAGGIKTGSPLKGLAAGALGGVGAGLGGAVGGVAGDVLSGAASGAAVSGFDPKGALLGGVAQGALGAFNGDPLIGGPGSGFGSLSTTPTTGVSGGSSSAAATSLPGVTPGLATGDLTGLGDATIGGDGIGALSAGGTGGETLQGITPRSLAGAEAATSTPFSPNLTNLTGPNPNFGDLGGSTAAVGGGEGALTAPGALSPTSVSGGAEELSAPPGWVPTDQAGTAGAASKTGIDSLFSKGGFLSRNSNYLLPAAGLAFAAGSQGTPPELKALEGQAADLAAQGKQYSSYLQTGNLPPGVKAAVDQATGSAKAHIRQQFASMGMTGSQSEVQALAEVDRSAAGQTFQMAEQLLQQGVQASNLSSQLYQMILSSKRADSQDLSNALVEFAAAAQGSGTGAGRSITLKAA